MAEVYVTGYGAEVSDADVEVFDLVVDPEIVSEDDELVFDA